MDNKLSIMILDDNKRLSWETFFKKASLSSYIDFKVFDKLEPALHYLHNNSTQLHIVISDFRLDGPSGKVTRLADKTFLEDETRALGANLTLYAEYLKKKDGCTIIVNKLYTLAKTYLEEYSVESLLMSKAYIDSELLKPFDVPELTDEGIQSLFMESIQDVQRLFFRKSKEGAEIKRKLHKAKEYIASISNEGKEGDRAKLKELIKEAIDEAMSIDLRRSQLSLPISAIFPALHYEYERYCKYFDKTWGESQKKKFNSLAEEINNVLNLSRDNTEEFALFLAENGLVEFVHDNTKALDDGAGHFKSDISEKAKKEPYRSVFGLSEILSCFSKCYGEFSSPKLDSYIHLFEKGISESEKHLRDSLCDDCKDILSGKELENRFLGFRAREDLAEELARYLNLPERNLKLEIGESSLSCENDEGEDQNQRLRVFIDKNRLLRAANEILKEINKYAYDSQDEKRVEMSFRYDQKIGCAKFVIEDFGRGMTRDQINKLSGGKIEDGGWGAAIPLLKDWVEDLWVISRTLEPYDVESSLYKRSIFRKEHNLINEGKKDLGTVCVILFNILLR